MSVKLSCHQWSLIAEKVMRETALSVMIEVMEPQERVEICCEEQNSREVILSTFCRTLYDMVVCDVKKEERSGRTEHDTPNVALLSISSSSSNESHKNYTTSNSKEKERMKIIQNELAEKEVTLMESSNAGAEEEKLVTQLLDERCAIGEMVRQIAEMLEVTNVDKMSHEGNIEGNSQGEETTLSITDTLHSILQKIENLNESESALMECSYNKMSSSNNVNQNGTQKKVKEHENDVISAITERYVLQEREELHQEPIDLEEDEEQEESIKLEESENASNNSCCRVLYSRILPPRSPSASEKMQLSLNSLRKQVQQLRRHDTSCSSTPTHAQTILKSNNSLVTTPRTYLESNVKKLPETSLTQFVARRVSSQQNHESEYEEEYSSRANLQCDEQSNNLPLPLTSYIKNNTTNVVGVNALFRGAAVPTRRLYPHFNRTVDYENNVKAAHWSTTELDVKCTNTLQKENNMERSPQCITDKVKNKIVMTPWRERIQELRQEIQTLRGAASNGDCQTSCDARKQEIMQENEDQQQEEEAWRQSNMSNH